MSHYEIFVVDTARSCDLMDAGEERFQLLC